MLTFEEIYTRRCEQKTQLNPRLKHYRNAILQRVNRKETKRQRKAYSTPLYNSDVHTCRRKTTPLSANACPLITKNKIGKEETVEEEDSEDELIQKLTEVFGKDTSRSCPDVKVSERTQNLKKIKNFKKKELTVLVRKEKRSPRNARVETKASNQHSVEPLKKLEKFKVQIPSHYTKAKPKKTHNIPSGAAAPEFKLKQQDTTSLISIPRKEEKKATIPEIPSIDSKPTSMTLPEKDFTPRQECHVSTLITHVDDSKEIEVKADEDIFVKQTDVDIFGKRTDEDISVKQTNQAQDIEDVEDKETEVIKRRRSPVRKREKIIRLRTENEVKELPSEPKVEVKKQSTWIYGDDKDDTSFEKVSTPLDVKYEVSALPTTPNIPQLPMEIPMKQAKCHIVSKHLVPVDAKPRWGNKKYDKSYDDERHRAELAERRRKKQMDMYEKLKLRKSGKQSVDEEVKKYASFDEYDFLAKYCIFDKTKRNMIQHAFNIVDEENKGWLNSEDVMVALRIVNSKLTETEEEYLSRIIEMTGYKITNGADFKLFSVLSALSTRISLLDSWMKNKIGMMDFKTLEMKLFMCKTLWECNVDHETNTIPLEQVMIELRAGGVSYEHECEVKRKLGHLKALDLFDFLTYVPLFIMIHETVIDNPLDESRIK